MLRPTDSIAHVHQWRQRLGAAVREDGAWVTVTSTSLSHPRAGLGQGVLGLDGVAGVPVILVVHGHVVWNNNN